MGDDRNEAEATATPPRANVRDRTMERMRRLLGMAAFGAVACGSPKGGSDPGYGVVDPMPTPARCAGGAPSIHGTAAFEVDPSGKRVLVLRLAPPKDPGYAYVVAPDDPTTHAEGGGLEARVTPAEGATSYTFSFALTCSEGPGTLFADVSWPSADVAPGTPLDVRVHAPY